MINHKLVNKDNIEHAIDVAEHLIIVLKRMKDDPEGQTGGLYRNAEEALFRRWQAVVGDFYSLVDTLNEELPKGFKFIFDTNDLSDMEAEGPIQ